MPFWITDIYEWYTTYMYDQTFQIIIEHLSTSREHINMFTDYRCPIWTIWQPLIYHHCVLQLTSILAISYPPLSNISTIKLWTSDFVSQQHTCPLSSLITYHIGGQHTSQVGFRLLTQIFILHHSLLYGVFFLEIPIRARTNLLLLETRWLFLLQQFFC